ncbi:hemolysin-iii channel protein [Apiospora saccharicola]|uniref:Hemolysin-iii channel protein n=1 Tax=Apiospora saccharicola TaxID=335842 RepID=A0ABR1THC6_9PEZI
MASPILSSEFHDAGAPVASRPQRRNRGGSSGGGLSGQVKALAQQADKRMSPKSKPARREGSLGARGELSLLDWDAILSIFSHVLGALLFLSLPYHIFNTEIPPRYAVATRADVMVCSVYFGGVAICFILSTM